MFSQENIFEFSIMSKSDHIHMLIIEENFNEVDMTLYENPIIIPLSYI